MATERSRTKRHRLGKSPIAVLACLLLIVIIGMQIGVGEHVLGAYKDSLSTLRERVLGNREGQDEALAPDAQESEAGEREAQDSLGNGDASGDTGGSADGSADGNADGNASAEIQQARAWLAELAVEEEVALGMPKYERAAFGQRWSDDVEVELGHNGCDTRNDILHRDLTNVQTRPNTRECVVTQGDFYDPYSGINMTFIRGDGTSDLVQIDHVVALANAWYAGAYTWDGQTRRNFANDPLNLQATTKQENQAKKAKTADQWLPSNPAYTCTYVKRQVHIKHAYGLSVTPGERQTMSEVLARC